MHNVKGFGLGLFYVENICQAHRWKLRLTSEIDQGTTIEILIPTHEKETDFMDADAIAVMAVDNLPNELPRDASQGFSKNFVTHVIPAFFNGDKDGILERARMTREGKLTPRYQYLEGYVKGLE